MFQYQLRKQSPILSASSFINFFKSFFTIDTSCQKVVVTLHRETKQRCKTTTIMKLNYTIDCNHCGAHTEYSTTIYSRTLSVEDVEHKMHIDTECAMRCPVCRYRLNSTEAEFYSQVHVTREA